MSTTSVSQIAPLTIADDETASRAVSSTEYRDAVSLLIKAPVSLDGDVTTRSIQVSSDGVAWASLVDAGGAVALPGAAQARLYYEMLPTYYWRIAYSSSPATTEFWIVTKQWSA